MHHESFFENFLYDDDVLYAIEATESFVRIIEQLMDLPPRPFTITRPPDAHRIAQLTGHEPDMGATDALGFSNFTGQVRDG